MIRFFITAVTAAVLLTAAACEAPERNGPRVGEPTASAQVGLDRFAETISSYDFDVTKSRLLAAIDRRDLTTFAVIDHAASAAEVDLDMPPATVVIFGDPAAGTPLMKLEPLLTAELPMRAAVYADDSGQIVVATTGLAQLARVYPALAPEAGRIAKIETTLSAIRDEAAGVR